MSGALASCDKSLRTILIVDDEVELCETLREVFIDEGFAVRVALNGREALDSLRYSRDKPCIVILDLLMPILDGDAVYVAMRADAELANIPVIVSTSDPSRAPEGVPVLAKPIDLGEMIATAELLCRCNER